MRKLHQHNTSATQNIGSNTVNENFIILNGDTIFDIQINELYNFHLNQNSDLTYSLYKLNKRNTEYGGIEYKKDNTITNHYQLNYDSKSSIIDAGLRIINKKSLYILIREMTNVNTSQITRVTNIFKKYYKKLLIKYDKYGTLGDEKNKFF